MLTRRTFLSAGGIAAAAGTRLRAQSGSGGSNSGPGNAKGVSTCKPTPAFVQAMPVMEEPPTRSGLSPGPVPGNHQHYQDYLPQKFYEMRVKEFEHRFHPNLGNTIAWGYDGKLPGPTFKAKYGAPIMVRIHNDLPANHTGFGVPEITTHLHNSHTASESDGFPGDFYGPGRYRDHHYCSKFAGEDSKEALGTLWYHDHRFDFTAQNVYRGLTGFYLLFDDLDTGDERTGFQLPSGEFDVPLVFQDKVLDQNNQLAFDFFNLDGILGDKYCVNGVIQPYMKVARRKYRFRLLDGGPSRFYEFALSSKQPMTIIANDGNLLPAPVSRPAVRLGVAERMDIIIDFSKYNRGDQVYLVNQLEQTNGRGPTGKILSPGIPVLRFDIDRDAPDVSVIPARMRTLPPVNLGEVAAQRSWVFGRDNGVWTVNGRIFDVNEVSAAVKENTAEIWTLKNKSGDWSHPIHIHFEEFQILSRNGRPAPAWEGRKDVAVVGPNEEVKIFMRFRDFRGRYPMHCHNLIHEDHAMMIRWDIVP
jgi:FtsP/CotA-like multicopper oxidase with cupredoxin domain